MAPQRGVRFWTSAAAAALGYLLIARTSEVAAEPSCRESWIPTDAPAFCPWRAEAALPAPGSYFAAATFNDNLYVLGGFRYDAATNQLVYYATVHRAKLGADGVISSWLPETSFQTGRSGLGVARLGRCLFVNAGGYVDKQGQAVYLDDTQSAVISPGGKPGSWTTSSQRLKTPRSNHSLLALDTSHGKYLYAVGGVTQIGPDTVHLDTIEVATVGDNCQLGEWKVASFHLRGGRSTPEALSIGEHLLVIGGWGDLDSIDLFRDVQVTSVRADGMPRPWQVALGPLPTGIYGHATTFYNTGTGPGSPVLFAVGGQPGIGAYGTWISYAYVNRKQALPDAIGQWRIAGSGQLSPGLAGHRIVTYRDRLYVLGGSAPGGMSISDVISSRIDPGAPLPPGPMP